MAFVEGGECGQRASEVAHRTATEGDDGGKGGVRPEMSGEESGKLGREGGGENCGGRGGVE